MSVDQTVAIGEEPMLLVRAGAYTCALPVTSVGEVLRPLPAEPLAGTPDFVLGVAVIRGRATPVLSLGMLLSGTAGETGPGGGRWVVLRVDERQAALAVDAVAGMRRIREDRLRESESMLREARPEAVARVGALDQQLLLVLEAGRIVPRQVWEALAATAAGR